MSVAKESAFLPGALISFSSIHPLPLVEWKLINLCSESRAFPRYAPYLSLCACSITSRCRARWKL